MCLGVGNLRPRSDQSFASPVGKLFTAVARTLMHNPRSGEQLQGVFLERQADLRSREFGFQFGGNY
jgi:hypothetical protein